MATSYGHALHTVVLYPDSSSTRSETVLQRLQGVIIPGVMCLAEDTAQSTADT